MDFRKPFRWALLYRVFSVGALAFGVVLIVIGVVAGFGSAANTLFTDPANAGSAIDEANPLITIAFALLGLIVWQVGKTYALFITLPRASGRAAARQFDSNKLRSDVIQGLDERLADMEADVAETRRSVQELKRSLHSQEFDERDVIESEDDRPALDAADTEPASATETDTDSTGPVEANSRSDDDFWKSESESTADTSEPAETTESRRSDSETSASEPEMADSPATEADTDRQP